MEGGTINVILYLKLQLKRRIPTVVTFNKGLNIICGVSDSEDMCFKIYRFAVNYKNPSRKSKLDMIVSTGCHNLRWNHTNFSSYRKKYS